MSRKPNGIPARGASLPRIAGNSSSLARVQTSMFSAAIESKTTHSKLKNQTLRGYGRVLATSAIITTGNIKGREFKS